MHRGGSGSKAGKDERELNDISIKNSWCVLAAGCTNCFFYFAVFVIIPIPE